MSLHEKNERLGEILREMDRILLAFSGGVDSTFLLARAYEEIGDNVLAVIAASETFPTREFNEAVALAKEIGAPHFTTEVKEFENEKFVANNPDRCYHCRDGLHTHLTALAREKGYAYVVDGTNASDMGDYRPGMKALREKGIRSPLLEAKLTKDDIRQLSKEMGLRTWNKPSFACLSSRIPYGTRITKSAIDRLDLAEDYMFKLGFYQVRVRDHDKMARIEVMPNEFEKVLAHHEEIHATFIKFGFQYVTLDLQGYRTGSMNEVLEKAGLEQ